jgi:hypothetical protein
MPLNWGRITCVCALLAAGCAERSALEVAQSPERSYVAHYSGDGGAIVGIVGETHKICVAPPAQSVLTLATKTSGSGTAKVKDAVELETKLDRETTEALTKMFEQNEKSLFLQYALYRLCEANASGMFSGTVATTEKTCEPLGELAKESRKALGAALEGLRAENAKLDQAQKEDDRRKARIAIDSAQKSVDAVKMLAGMDTRAYGACVRQIGGSAYERKFSHIIEASLDLYEMESKRGDKPSETKQEEKTEVQKPADPVPAESTAKPEEPATPKLLAKQTEKAK